VFVEVKTIWPDDSKMIADDRNVPPQALELLESRIPLMFISIMDEGVGIVPELLERIFDISFTEVVKIKSPETGFGLGLPIVKELVEDHGGFVIVNSKVGKGSTFTIVLPVYNVSMEFQIALKNEIRKQSGTITILPLYFWR